MKCSQCGCTDLVGVKFPQEVSLILTAIGISGETNAYDIRNKVHCDTFICINCGHFEFFNLSLSKQIVDKRKTIEKTKFDINNIENELVKLHNIVQNKNEEIEKLKTEAQNLDITLRRNNEIQTLIACLRNETIEVNKIIKKQEIELTKLKKLLTKLNK